MKYSKVDEGDDGEKRKKSILIVVALWSIAFLQCGILKSIGVLLPVLEVQFGTHAGTVGVVVSFVKLSGNIMGIFAQPLTQIFEPRYVIIVCGVLSPTGLLISSVAQNIPVLFIGMFFTGFIAVADTLALALISSYFTKYYVAATNIVTTGLPGAIMVFAPVTQILIDTYGWRGTMMLFAALSLHCVAAGAILMPVQQKKEDYKHRHYYEPIDGHGINDRDLQTYSPIGNNNKQDRHIIKKQLRRLFNASLFSNGPFMVLLIIQLLSGFTFNGWVVYFVSFALSKGQTPVSAANVPLFSGIAVFFIRGVLSMVMNPPPAKYLLYIGALLEALSFACFYITNTFWTLSAASFIFGLGYGLVGSQIYIAVIDVIRKEDVVCAVAYIQLLHGIGYLISGYTTGWLFDQTGSYSLSLITHVVVCLILVATLGIQDIWNYGQSRINSITCTDNSE